MKKLLVLILLAGCQTTPTPTPMDVAKNVCTQFGYTDGTQEYRQCLQNAFNAEQQRRAAIGAALFGQQLRPQPVVYQPMPTQNSTTCTPDGAGGFTCR